MGYCAGSPGSDTALECPPPRGGARYAPSLWLFQGGFRGARPGSRLRNAAYLCGTAPLAAEEIIVARAMCRSFARANPPIPACRAALRHTPASSASCLPPRRVAALACADRMNQKPSVSADATPTENLRDAMIQNASGFLPHSLLPHSTASPARLGGAAAARLGVLPEWQNVCLSTPPTPKKLG